MVHNKEEFVLEVTDRHVTDVTGSILVAENSRPRLLETSQIPQPLVRFALMHVHVHVHTDCHVHAVLNKVCACGGQ